MSATRRKHWRNENVSTMSACGRHLNEDHLVNANPEAVDCERCRSTYAWGGAVREIDQQVRRALRQARASEIIAA